MDIVLFKNLLQHIMLVGSVVFLLNAYSSYRSYKVHKLKMGLNFCFMCLCSGLYSLIYYLGTIFEGFGVDVFLLTFVFAFSAFYFYLSVIEDFLEVKSKFIFVSKIILLIVVFFNVLGFFSGLIVSEHIIFTPVEGVYKTAIGKVMDPKHTTSSFGKIVCAFGMLAVIVSSAFLFFVIRKKRPDELLLLWGVVLSLVTAINDIVMGMSIFYFLFPLSYFGNAFEVFRFSHYFQKKAFLKVQELKGELTKVAQAAQVGYVAGSITHDVRNPLTVIMYGVHFLSRSLKNNPSVTQRDIDSLSKIKKQALNIQSIIEMYTGLMYVENDVIKKDEVSLDQVIFEAMELSQKHVENIKVNVKNNVAKGQVVLGNKNVLVLCLTNILNNSCQAIDQLDQANPWIEFSFNSNTLSITDSGSGIDKEIADKIFEPQFTTKTQKEGTGLGLSIVREILSRYGQKIKLDRSSSNTKFDIIF